MIFGGNLGELQLTHHAHDEQYSLPLTIGKGIQYCCYKFPFEPAIATLFAAGVLFDEAAKALELFGTANVAVAYAAAAGALQLTEGKTKAGIVWPEELDAARFIALANTLGLTLNLTAS